MKVDINKVEIHPGFSKHDLESKEIRRASLNLAMALVKVVQGECDIEYGPELYKNKNVFGHDIYLSGYPYQMKT
jgi:hypothetical protein